MQYSKTGLELTNNFESCRLTAYPDQRGIWTIGWGHTSNVKKGDTCTQTQADNWLMQDVQASELAVNRALTAQALSVLTQEEFDAIVDFVFNIGESNFRNSTLLRLVNMNQFAEAANEFDKWDHVNGKEVAGLLRRREAETKEFESVPQGKNQKPASWFRSVLGKLRSPEIPGTPKQKVWEGISYVNGIEKYRIIQYSDGSVESEPLL